MKYFEQFSESERYLLAIHTLYDTQNTMAPKIKSMMSSLLGRTYVDMEIDSVKLEREYLLTSCGYNWRTDKFDYAVPTLKIVGLMIDLAENHIDLAKKVLSTKSNVQPCPLRSLLWNYITSGYKLPASFNDVTQIKALNNSASILFDVLDDARFTELVLLISPENAKRLFNDYLESKLDFLSVVDTKVLRSHIEALNNKKNSLGICLSELDFYEYIRDGKIPEKLLAKDYYHCSIAAIVQAYRGNLAEAYKHVCDAMSLYKKATRSVIQGQMMPHIHLNFFFVLICHLEGSSAAQKTAIGLVKATERSKETPVGILYNILSGKATLTKIEQELQQSIKVNSYPICIAFHFLLDKYMSLNYTHEVLVIERDFLLINSELRKYIDFKPEVTKRINAAFGQQGLLSSIYRKQEWEKVLEELAQQKAGTNNTTANSNARISYVISDIDAEDAQPRLQTRLKNGTWGAGKNISISNFMSADMLEMTSADKIIARATFNLFKNNYYYDSTIPLSLILPHMVKESRLYMGVYAPFVLVEVTEAVPYINITKTAKHFTISSNVPENKIEDDLIFFSTSSTSICFIKLSDAQKVYYSRLLSLKTFPLEAEEPLKEFLNSIGSVIEVNSDLIEGGSTLPLVDSDSKLTIQLRPCTKESYFINTFVRPIENGAFKCRPGKGEALIIDTDSMGNRVRTERDIKAEKKNYKAFCELIGLDARSNVKDLEIDIYNLLPILEYASQHPDTIICEWLEGTNIKIRSRSGASWGATLNKNANGWFELEGNVELDQNKVLSMAQLLDLVNQSGSRFIKLGENDFIAISDSLHKQLMSLGALATRSHGKLQMSPFSAAVLSADMLDGEMSLTYDQELQEIRDRIIEASTYKAPVPKELNATLRNYQKEGYEWISRLNKWGAGALLADDMGLGKTVQTITFILSKANEGPALVVAPASVAPNWKVELEKFAPSLNAYMLNYSSNRRDTILNAKAGDVVISSYGLLLGVQDDITTKKWTTICLDEAHVIKNRGAKTSAVAMKLQSDYRIMLTGTPIQNHLGELWNLFQFVNPGLLGSFDDFNHRFIQPIEQNGDNYRRQMLDRMVKPFMLRRTKDKVAKELPEKEEIYQRVAMSEEEMLIYEVLRQKAENMLIAEGANNVSVTTLAEITRLRQCSCDVRLVKEGQNSGKTFVGSKIQTIIELLQTIIEGFTVNSEGVMQGGVLVFSQFTSYLALIQEALKDAGIPYLYIDGSVNIKTRQKLVEEFQSGCCPVFLISLKAGGLGLNLTRANYVIHADPWWNPAIEAQATDRAHRIGQTNHVTVYHLIAEGTIEEKIQRLHERKQALARDILESTDMSHKLTGKDLLDMVKKG